MITIHILVHTSIYIKNIGHVISLSIVTATLAVVEAGPTLGEGFGLAPPAAPPLFDGDLGVAAGVGGGGEGGAHVTGVATGGVAHKLQIPWREGEGGRG